MSFEQASGKRPEPSACDRRPTGRSSNTTRMYSQGLSLSLEERVRRKLILASILPKLSNFGQGATGQAIKAAGAGQFGRLHKEALKLHDRIRYNTCTAYTSEQTWCSRGHEQKRTGAHGGSLFGLRLPCLRRCIWRRSVGGSALSHTVKPSFIFG
jgi:hypothetical protein